MPDRRTEPGLLMFTGIIAERGRVQRLESGEDSAVLRVSAPGCCADTEQGASIAVNGVCLTVTCFDAEGFEADVMAESLRRSSLGDLRPGSVVNLEPALRVSDRLGGHIVQGHVDGTATLLHREHTRAWDMVRFRLLQPDLRRYVAEKGSIALDGVSLTVTAVTDDGFTVGLIPTTLAETTLGQLPVGRGVNVEVDVLAKYAERLLTAAPPPTPAGTQPAGGGGFAPTPPQESRNE